MRLSFLSLLILVVIVGAAVGGAYGAGIAMGKGSAPTSAQAQTPSSSGTAGTTGAAGASGAAGAFAAGTSGRAGAGGGATLGTVQSVTGNTLTISSQSGGTVQVTLSDTTSIRKTVDGTKDDLKQGEEVVVSGQQGTGGGLTASSIQIVPAGNASGQVRGGSDQPAAPSPSQTPRARQQGAPPAQ